MNKLRNVNVKMVNPINATSPILFRRYTLTHSDENGELFLTIAPFYDLDSIDQVKRDEVCGQWVIVNDDIYILTLFVFVGNFSYEISSKRYQIFLEELPLAVSSILNADKDFFNANSNLIDSNISMRFISSHAEFNKTVFYCRVKDFLD